MRIKVAMNVICLAFGLILIIGVGPSYAYSNFSEQGIEKKLVNYYHLGRLSCDEFRKHLEKDQKEGKRTLDEMTKSWVSGYVSALNEIFVHQNAQLDGADILDTVSNVFEICKKEGNSKEYVGQIIRQEINQRLTGLDSQQ